VRSVWVTSDRALADRVRVAGAGVQPAGGFRAQLDAASEDASTPASAGETGRWDGCWWAMVRGGVWLVE
jgi:hypothetical protein